VSVDLLVGTGWNDNDGLCKGAVGVNMDVILKIYSSAEILSDLQLLPLLAQTSGIELRRAAT
jgi:hypothetical protein